MVEHVDQHEACPNQRKASTALCFGLRRPHLQALGEVSNNLEQHDELHILARVGRKVSEGSLLRRREVQELTWELDEQFTSGVDLARS